MSATHVLPINVPIIYLQIFLLFIGIALFLFLFSKLSMVYKDKKNVKKKGRVRHLPDSHL